MIEKFVNDAKLQRGRLVVVADGVTIHDGWLWELASVGKSKADHVEYRMHPADVKAMDAFDRKERKAKRRAN